jgi:uncharacterized Zn-binding protein involved in type VI secretion
MANPVIQQVVQTFSAEVAYIQHQFPSVAASDIHLALQPGLRYDAFPANKKTDPRLCSCMVVISPGTPTFFVNGVKTAFDAGTTFEQWSTFIKSLL